MDLNEFESQKLLIQQLKDLVRQKDSEVEEKNRCLKEAESKIAKSRLQLKAKDAKLSNLKKSMNESRASGGSQGRHESRSGDSANAKSKLLFQQKKIEEKERTIEIQQQTLQEQESRFDKLREEFHNRHEELCQRLQQVSTNQGIDVTELTDNTPHVKDLYSAIMTKDQKIAELMSQVDESNFKLQNITQEFQKSEEECARLSAKYEMNENSIARQSSRVSELEDLVKSMSKGYESETNTIEDLQRQVEKLEMKLRDKEETVALKEEQILQLKRENTASLDDMQETNHQHDQLLRSLKRKLHEQEEVLAGKDKVVVLLQSELTDRSIELSGMQNTIQVLQETIRETVKANNGNAMSTDTYSEDRKNNNSDDDEELVDLSKSSWDDGNGINFKNKYDQLLVQKDLQIAENAALKEHIQELDQKSYRLEVQLRELNQQFNDESVMWREKEMAYDVKLTSFSEDASNEDAARAQEDLEMRMQTILSQLNNQTKVLEDQTYSLEKSEAEVKLLKQNVSSYKTNNNQLQAELKEQKKQFEARTVELREHMQMTEQRFNLQMHEVERAKHLFQEYLDQQHDEIEQLLVGEHFSREVDNLVSSGDCSQYSDQINQFKNQVDLLRRKSQERIEPTEHLTPAILCLIEHASSRTLALESTFNLSRKLIRCLRKERDQIRCESDALTERLRKKRSISEQVEELRRELKERDAQLESQAETIERLTVERSTAQELEKQLKQIDARFSEFATDAQQMSRERESWIEEMKATHERDIVDAHRDKADLEARLEAVTRERDVMTSERDAAQERLRTAEKENDDVLWGMDEKLSKLEAELDGKGKEHEVTVSEMLAKHEEMVEGLMCDLESVTSRLESEKDELLHKLKEATRHVEELKRDKDECREKIKNLAGRNQEVEIRIESLTRSCVDREQDWKSAVEKRDAAEKVVAELRSHLADSSDEISKLQANIQEKAEALVQAQKEGEDLSKKVEELERANEKMASNYWTESDGSDEKLRRERDDAINRATDLQDAVDEHQSEVEKKLVDTEDKLKHAKLQLQDKINANGFDNDLQMFQDPSLMKGDNQKQQTIEFLQSQLEELAREQEYQASEHMTMVGRLNENIERLTEEKDDLSTSLERQVENLNEIVKRYDEKELDYRRLIRVVEDLQRKLDEAKALREDRFVTSQKYTSRLRQAEDKINELEDKLQESMEELMLTKDEKEKCELKIPELSRKLEETHAENLSLLDELKQCRNSIDFLQQELDAASESAEQIGSLHRDEIEQLKSLLRERDKAVTRLNGDLIERDHAISSLNQTCVERTRQYEQQEVKLAERNNKVLELEGSLREYESELVALSQHSNGAMEKAQFRARDLAEYVNKLEERVQSSDTQKVVLEKQVENLCEKLAMNDQELADIRRSCEEKEAELRKKLFDSECSLDAQMRDLKELEEKKQNEIEEEKGKSQELQVKLDCQALEVSRLTSYLEDQIYESNDHHRKERTCLEDQVKTLKSKLHDHEKRNEKLQEDLSVSTQFTATLSSKVEELEKWEGECQEKSELCSNLQSSCDLLEERLQEASKRAREFEQRLIEVTSQLKETRDRLDERDARVKALFDELTRTNNEVRTLKDALCEESERQLNELNSMVEERLAERDNQIAATAERVNELCAVINMKDLHLVKLKEELQQVKRSSQDAVEAKSKELEHFQAANQHLHEEFDALKVESSRTETSLQQVVVELKSKVEELSADAEESSLNTSRLDEELNRTTHQLNETRDNGERALQEKDAKYEAQKEKAKRIMKALQLRFKEEKEKLEREVKAMREQRGEERNAELSALQRRVEESEHLSASLRDQLASLVTSSQEEVNVQDDMITQLKSQITHLTQQTDDLATQRSRDAEQLQEENSTLCRQLADLRDEASRLRQQNDVIGLELERARKENESLSAAHHEHLQRKSSDESSLEAEMTSLRSQLASLALAEEKMLGSHEESVRSLEEKVEARDREVDDVTRRIQSVSSELEEARSTIESLRREVKDESEQMEEKQHEVGEMQRKLKAALISRKSILSKMKELEARSKEKEDAASATIALLHHQVTELESASMKRVEEESEKSSLMEKNSELIGQISQLEEERTTSASAHEKSVASLEKELETLRRLAVELGEEQRRLLEEKTTSENELREDKLKHMNFVSDAEKESCMLKEEISNLLASQKKSQQLESELNDKVETLENQKSQLESDLNEKVETLENQKNRLESELNDVETLKNQKSQLESDLNEKVETLETQKSQLESELNDKIETLENQKSQLESELNEVETLKNQKSQLESDLNEKVETLENQKSQLESELTKKIETLKNQKSQLESDLNEKVETLETQKSQLESELNDKIETLENQKSQLESELNEVETLKNQKSQLESDLNEKVETLEKQKSQLESALNEKVETLENQKIQLESELTEKILQNLEKQKSQLESALNEKVETLENQKSQLESELNKKIETLENQKSQLESELSEKIETLENQKIQNESELSEKILENLEKQKSQLESDLSEKIETLKNQKSQLESELNEKIETLENQKSQLESELSSRHQDYEDMKCQFDEMRQDLNKQVENLSKASHESQESCQQLEKEFEEKVEAHKREKEEWNSQLKEHENVRQARFNKLKEEISDLLESQDNHLELEDELNKKIRELEQEKNQLESDLNDARHHQNSESVTDSNLSQSLQESQANCQRLEELISAIRQDKSQFESEIERLELESDELRKLVEKFEGELEESNAEKESLRSEMAKLEDNTESLQEMAELKMQVESLNKQLEELQCDHESLQDSMKAKHGELKSRFEASQAELELELKEADDKREAALHEALQVKDQLSSRIETLQEEKRRLDAALKCAEENACELQSQLSSKAQLLDDAVKKVDDLQNNVIGSLNEKLSALQLTIANSSVAEEKLQKSSSDSQATITTLHRKLKAALVSRKELMKSNSQLEADLKLSKTETEFARSQVSSLNEIAENRNSALRQLSQSCEERAALRTQMEELEATMSACRDEKDRVEEELKKTRSQVKTLKEEVRTLETCNKDLNDTTSALEVNKSKLERSLADKTEMLRSAQKCIRKLEKSGPAPPPPEGGVEVEKVKKHNEELTQTIAELTARADENRGRVDALSLQLEDARARREDLESQLDTLRNQVTSSPTEEDSPVPKCDEADNNVGGELHTANGVVPTVECEDVEVQTNSVDDELEVLIRKARLALIEETLTQLKSTQPDMWEQEPGIKKLIDRMELAMSQATKRQKQLDAKERELGEAVKRCGVLKDNVGSVEEENARLREESEQLPGLRKEVEESRKRVAAVLRDCDHLNTALQSEKDSYEQVHRRLERDNHMLREKMNHRLVAEQELGDQLNELKLKVGELEREKAALCSSRDRLHDEMEVQLKSARGENETLKTEMEKMKASLMKKSEEIRDTERKLEESKRTTQLTTTQLEESLQRHEHDRGTIVTRLTDDVARLTNRLRAATDDYDVTVARMVQEAESRVNEVAELKSLLAQKDAQLVSIHDQMSERALDSEKEMAAVQESSKVEFETLHGADMTEAAVTSSPTATGGSNDQMMLEMELKNREALISRLLTDCVKLKSLLAAADSQRESSQTRIDSLFTQIKSLTALRIQYESNENHLKSELSEKDRIIERHFEELHELRMKRDRFLAAFSSSSSCSTLSQARKAIEAERKEATREQLRLELAVSKLEEEKEQLAAKLKLQHSVVNERVVELEEELERMLQEQRDAEDRHTEQINNMMADTQELKEELITRSKTVDNYEVKLKGIGLMIQSDRHIDDECDWLFDAIKLRMQQANDFGNAVNVQQAQLGEVIQQRDDAAQQLTQAAQALHQYQQQYSLMMGNYNALHDSYKSLQGRYHKVEAQLKEAQKEAPTQQGLIEAGDVQKISLDRSGNFEGDRAAAVAKNKSNASVATTSEVEDLYERIEKSEGEKSLLQERIGQLEDRLKLLHREQKAEDWKLEMPTAAIDGEESEILLTNSSIVKTVRRSRGCVSKLVRMGRSNHRIKLFSFRTLAFIYMMALHFIALRCIFLV